jgi:signal transduction histidine kinase
VRSASLVRRAIVSVLLIEFLCASIFVLTALWHERGARLRALDDTIAGRSDSLVGAVQDAEDPADSVLIDPAEFHPPASDVFAVYNPDGRLVGASGQAPGGLVELGADGFHNSAVDGHPYRVLQRRAMRIIDREETGGVGRRRPTIVVYAVRMDRVWHEIDEAVRFYALMSGALLCVTAAVLIYLLRRLLSPLKELAAEAAQIKADSLAFRPPQSALRTRELAPLATALSETMQRLKLSFENEQRFFNDAAHELKTAVAVVRSTIQVSTMRLRSAEEYREGLDRALTDNGRVEDLVARMLTLGRTSERAGSTAEPVDLAHEAASALKNISSFAESRGVAIVSALFSVDVLLSAEHAQTLVSNLVMNAVQHSPQDAEVQVAVRVVQTGVRAAVLEVHDSGSGIAAENFDRVFERFFREDPSRSRQTGGAGLGLAICKNIVESAGGVIQIESAPNKGTTVRATFPLE